LTKQAKSGKPPAGNPELAFAMMDSGEGQVQRLYTCLLKLSGVQFYPEHLEGFPPVMEKR